jgi:hypothetical protein
MDAFLEKLKLKDHLTTSLQMTQNDFVDKLSRITDEGSTGIFTNPFEAFSSSKNEFKGHVSYEGFELKRRIRFFDNNNMAVAKELSLKNNRQLTIETVIKGFNGFIIFFYLLLLAIYCPFLIGIINADHKITEENYF